MKSTNKKLILAGLIVGSLLTATSALAGIANTKHNLGAAPGGTGTNKLTGAGATTEICVFCHTPHGAADGNDKPPLWNKTLTDASTYQTYDTLGTTSLDGGVAEVGSVSIACLSCHDGSQAMDVVLNEPGSGIGDGKLDGTWSTGANNTLGKLTGIANLSKDLTNDHPIGIQYGGGGISASAPTGATTDVDFKTTKNATANGQLVWWVDTGATGVGTREKTDMQLYTRQAASFGNKTTDAEAQPYVECATCHDPHSTNTTFLRIPNENSEVCLACHKK
jgi:predicted CXXCH cytochrome family protein